MSDITKQADELQQQIGELPTKSKIFAAMSKAFGEVESPRNQDEVKSVKESFGNLLTTIRPVFGKHGLMPIQEPRVSYGYEKDSQGDQKVVKATIAVDMLIIHESGEFMKVAPLVLQSYQVEPQEIEDAILYARQCQLGSIFGLVPDENLESLNQRAAGQANARKCNSDEIQMLKDYAAGGGVNNDALSKTVKRDYDKSLTEISVDEMLSLLVRLCQKAKEASKAGGGTGK